MLGRLWLLLVCVLTMAPLPASAEASVPARPMAEAAAEPEHDQPTIEADLGPLASDLRAPERAELLTVVARILATGEPGPSDADRRGVFRCASRAHRHTGWSDVVQCRRWAGAHVLRYATPPPARA